jgi:hypothetical protein
MCDLEDRIASDYETGFSEQALRQLMKEAFLLEMERKALAFSCSVWALFTLWLSMMQAVGLASRSAFSRHSTYSA